MKMAIISEVMNTPRYFQKIRGISETIHKNQTLIIIITVSIFNNKGIEGQTTLKMDRRIDHLPERKKERKREQDRYIYCCIYKRERARKGSMEEVSILTTRNKNV